MTSGRCSQTTTPAFLLSGAFLSCNLGTAAMALATSELLKHHFPSCRIKVLSTRSNIDKRLYPNIDVIKDHRTSLTGLIMCGKALIWCAINRCLHMDLRGLRSSDALDAYFQTDLMIDLSGDTITEDYGPLVLLSHCIPIIIAACFDKPFVLFGQTIGPFSWAKPFVLPLLKRSESIIARDAVTYHYLQSIGLKREQLVSSIDTAFMLKPHFSQRVDRLMRSFKLKPKKDLTIGMTISYQYQQFLKQRTGKEALKILPAVIDRFISEYDARLIFFPHVTGPGALLDDRKMASDVRQACRFKDRVAVLCDELSPQEIKALISKCDLFCGARMHSNIAASTSSVPTVSLSYSVKSRGIMARLGMADWVVEFDQLSTEYLYRTIQRLNAQRFSVSNCLKSISPQLSLKAESNVNVIKKILHQRRQR